MSQKRVAIVLASLVGTMTLSAGALLLMEGGLGASPYTMAALDRASLPRLIQPQVPLQKSNWKFIIIYESGELGATADSLAKDRLRVVDMNGALPPRRGANFHFVVDAANSRQDLLDGKLEVGRTWLNQECGTPHAGWPDARYYSSDAYKTAVGICVSGNLNERPMSEGQYRNLLELTQVLQQQLGISKDRILFQWELPLAARVTPAQQQFAAEFRRALD